MYGIGSEMGREEARAFLEATETATLTVYDYGAEDGTCGAVRSRPDRSFA